MLMHISLPQVPRPGGSAHEALANRTRSERPVPKLPAESGESLDLNSFGLTFAFSVLIGFGNGYGIDRQFHTAPFLMLIFILLGLASGIITIVSGDDEQGNG
jgi:ATP synthase protein I